MVMTVMSIIQYYTIYMIQVLYLLTRGIRSSYLCHFLKYQEHIPSQSKLNIKKNLIMTISANT